MQFTQNFVRIEPDDTKETLLQKAATVLPTERQYRWQTMELTAFIHFGTNTFTDREWGDGTASPSVFAPTELDARQWIGVLAEAGFKGVILSCKHHDGFCLWPSRYTDYTVAASPWRDGKGDVVREVADACREYGVKFGVYLSPWDRHDARYGDSERYNDFFCDQLTELLTDYGEVYEVWFDGACAEGPNGKKQEYDWARYYSLIRRLAPDAVISISGPDVRWIGNEAGRGRKEEWSVVPMYRCAQNGDDGYLLFTGGDPKDRDIGSGAALLAAKEKGSGYLSWFPAQVDTSIRPGWFYHSKEDNQVKNLATLAEIYRVSVGGNTQLLLNIPPDRRGLFHENDVKRLREFGAYIRAASADDLAEGGAVQTEEENGVYRTTLTLPKPAVCNQITLMEDVMQGQRVAAFRVIGRLADGSEKTLGDGKTVGYKKMLPFSEETLTAVTVETTDYRLPPVYRHIGLHRTPKLLAAPVIHRQKGAVTITAEEGAAIRYGVNGRPDRPYEGPFELTDACMLTAVAHTPETGDSPIGQQRFGFSRRNWVILSSTHTPMPGSSLADCITEHAPPARFGTTDPITLIIDLGERVTAGRWIFDPATEPPDTESNLRSYRIEMSEDGESWTTALEGEFDNLPNNPLRQIRPFETPFVGRYLRFTVVESFGMTATALGQISLCE